MSEPAITWLPADWVDEYTPPMLPSPTDFINQREDGGWEITAKERDFKPLENEDRICTWRLDVAIGDVVSFNSITHFGEFALTIRDDEDRTFLTSAPRDANTFWINCLDEEGAWGSVEEAVSEANDNEGLEPGSYTIEAYTWSGDQNFQLELDASGKPHFVSLGRVN